MLWLKTLNEEQWRLTDHAIENVWKCEVCDVLYEKEYALLLPGIFKRALAPGGMVILADPGRIGVPEFMDECRYTGLSIICTSGDLPSSRHAFARVKAMASV